MRRCWPALIVAALIAAGVYVFAPRTTASEAKDKGPVALLLVASRSQSVLVGPSPTPAEVEAFRRTQAALLKSEFVLNAALRSPAARDALKAHADPMAWLTAHLTVEHAEGSEVLKVRVTGLPKADAVAVVNAVVEAYQKQAVESGVQWIKERVQRLQDARLALQQRITTKQAELTARSQAAGVPPDAADHRASIAAQYQERAALRVEAAKGTKSFKNELADLDGRIRRAEDVSVALNVLRAEITRIEAVDGDLATELLRTEMELVAPGRIMVLKLAE